MSPKDLQGRDRSPSGPALQTLALSEKSPYPESSPENAQPSVQSRISPEGLLWYALGCHPKTSKVGTALRAVRHRRRWRFQGHYPIWGAARTMPIRNDSVGSFVLAASSVPRATFRLSREQSLEDSLCGLCGRFIRSHLQPRQVQLSLHPGHLAFGKLTCLGLDPLDGLA